MPSDGVYLVSAEGMTEMRHARYETEDLLQRLLERYPALLSGRQVNPAQPREWLLIAREQGVPKSDGGADQWSADHLFVDQDGIPTIVEVKRSTDTRIRREVVGQMLDYAANGVRYWPVERLQRDLASQFPGDGPQQVEQADQAVRDLLARAQFDGATPDAFWSQVADNLTAGRIRMLFVADVIPPELQRIIEFLNEQMTHCEVLGIEIRQYTAEGHQVLAPTVIGHSSVSRQVKRQSQTRPFEETMEIAADEVRDLDARLDRLAEANQWAVTTSKAARQYRLPSGQTLIQFFPADAGGSLQFHLAGIYDAGLSGQADELRTWMERISGKAVSARQPWIPIAPLIDHWDQFTQEFVPAYLTATVSALRIVDRPV